MKDTLATVFKNGFTPVEPMSDWTKEEVADWAKSRAFYNGTAAYNVFDYLFNEKKIATPSEEQLKEDAMRRLGIGGIPNKHEAKSITEYMTRFNTVGAFNLNGVMTKKELDEFREKLRSTGSNIWHGYLSIPPSLSVKASPDSVMRLCRATFGKFLRDAKLDPNNIALMCSVHGDTDHAHFHYVFYEKEPLCLDKHGKEKYHWRGELNKTAVENYRLSTTAYIDENKEDFFSYRDVAMRLLRSSSPGPSDAELYNALRELSNDLPRTGRLQYNAEQIAPFRNRIDNIVSMLFKRNPEAMEQHKKALREIARRGKELGELKNNNGNYVRDMNAEYMSRLGNVVLKLVNQLRFDPANKYDFRPNFGKPQSKRLSAQQQSRQNKAASRRRRFEGKRVIDAVIHSLAEYERNARTDFTYELHRAELEIAQSNSQRS